MIPPKGIIMEQKKTLWIVAATGVFLGVVFVTAMILYSPSVKHNSASSASVAGYNPESGWVSPAQQSVTPVQDTELAFQTEAPSEAQNVAAGDNLPPSPLVAAESKNEQEQNIARADENFVRADKLTVISDNTTVYSETTTIDLNSLKASSNSGVVARNERTANQINTNRPREPLSPPPAREPLAENYYAPAPVAKSPAPVPKAGGAGTTAKATPARSVAKSEPAQTKAVTAAKVAASAKKAPDSFWVQAAAYTSKRNADEARSTLESNKISSEVFTFTDSNGRTFYRVRVGPYVTKSEAEYWQTRIAMIDKFASSKSVIVNTAVN